MVALARRLQGSLLKLKAQSRYARDSGNDWVAVHPAHGQATASASDVAVRLAAGNKKQGVTANLAWLEANVEHTYEGVLDGPKPGSRAHEVEFGLEPATVEIFAAPGQNDSLQLLIKRGSGTEEVTAPARAMRLLRIEGRAGPCLLYTSPSPRDS